MHNYESNTNISGPHRGNTVLPSMDAEVPKSPMGHTLVATAVAHACNDNGHNSEAKPEVDQRITNAERDPTPAMEAL